MELRKVGDTDLLVSVVGLGCNNFGGRLDLEGSRLVIDRALERGVTFFDTADSYGNRGGSETILGQTLGRRRDAIVLATKFGWPLDKEGKRKGASRTYVISAVEDSLRRLRTDRIDLYQQHLPDPDTPIEETVRALESLVRQGKIRYVGCSNFNVEQFAEARAVATNLGAPGFVSCQNHYNLITRGIEKTLIPELQRQGASLLPYAPLAAGLLTGKYRRDKPMPAEARLTKSPGQADRYLNPTTWDVIESLIAFSSARGRSLLELAVAWLAARNPVCSVIAGAMSPQQVDANVAAVAWRLTTEELDEIDRLTNVEARGRDE